MAGNLHRRLNVSLGLAAALLATLVAACNTPAEPTPAISLPTAAVSASPTQILLADSQSPPTPTLTPPSAIPPTDTPLPTDSIQSTNIPVATHITLTASSTLPSTVVRTRPENLIDLKDILGRAATTYAGSSPPRGNNVRLGTSKLNDMWVPPGGTVSFNDEVGPTTLSAGFQQGYGIALKEGQTDAIDPVAGGITQVATTLFQAVYWAGLEIVERWPHLSWDPRYGESPSGSLGLDAAVDDPLVDFKFRNTTGYWIHIKSEAGDSSIAFTISGIAPGWKVTSAEPVITNVFTRMEDVVRVEEPELAAGEELPIGRAENGFDLMVARQVIDQDDRVLEDNRFVSRYLPARNILLVGTDDGTPTPTEVPLVPTATPGFDPGSYKLPDGRIRTPDLVGMREAEAQVLINEVGLMTSYVNYQGPDDVPAHVLETILVGHVLSQTPAPGTPVQPGTRVLIAVRNE